MTVLRDELQRTLGGAYTLERELGGGGMSTVFVAQDHALGRTVVIKVLPYELAATVSVERFKREIMLSAALQHPHIVPVLSAGETSPDADSERGGLKLPFFIMPYVEGESLRARLSRGPLSVREVVSILKDVARALVYAHGRGIIHRDIKPDNILLSSGSATVTDFGVAKAITASREGRTSQPVTSTGTITIVGTSIGTPAYMAPEQAAGDPSTDHRADLYALGIVGYEMLVGTPPFHGRAPQQLLAAQLTEPPPPIATRRYDVPEALASLLMRLLEKEPSKRPKNAAEVARGLEDPAVVSGTFVSVQRPAAARPKRVLWALAGAGILASVAAGGAWFSNRHAAAPGVAPATTTAVAATAHGTSDPQAYDLYLRGRFFFDKRGEASLRRALDYFEQAAKKDSMFARAYAGIANVYAVLPLYANVRADSLMPVALRAIDRAVTLDSSLAETFASRAGLLQAGWRWSDAESDYQRALRLDSTSVAAHQWYGELLLLNGRIGDALSQLERATELDRLSPVAYGSYALGLAVAHAPDSAIAAAKRAVELDSTLLVARFMLGTVYLEAGHLPDAIRELEAAAKVDSSSVQTLGLLGYAYAKSGNVAKGSDLARRLEARIGKVSGAAAAAARVYLGLGNGPRALTLLERAAADHDASYSSESLAENFFDPIRSDPRFAKIVGTVGLDTRLLNR